MPGPNRPEINTPAPAGPSNEQIQAGIIDVPKTPEILALEQKLGRPVEPVYAQGTISRGRGGASQTLDYGPPIGYRYDNGQSQYVNFDTSGQQTSIQDRQNLGTLIKGLAPLALAYLGANFLAPALGDLFGETASLGADEVSALTPDLPTLPPTATPGAPPPPNFGPPTFTPTPLSDLPMLPPTATPGTPPPPNVGPPTTPLSEFPTLPPTATPGTPPPPDLGPPALPPGPTSATHVGPPPSGPCQALMPPSGPPGLPQPSGLSRSRARCFSKPRAGSNRRRRKTCDGRARCQTAVVLSKYLDFVCVANARRALRESVRPKI